jgi:heat shock protein HslJ
MRIKIAERGIVGSQLIGVLSSGPDFLRPTPFWFDNEISTPPMKSITTFLFPLLIIGSPLLVPAQTFQAPESAQSSIDWPGTYVGTLPCADCQGVRTLVRLKGNNQYQISETHLGKSKKPIVDTGKIIWLKDGTRITLSHKPTYFFMVSKSGLLRLNAKAEAIPGPNNSAYLLKKSQSEFTEKYWKLMEVNGERLDRSELTKDPYITFSEDSATVRGFGGCNSFGGKFKLSDNRVLKFSAMHATLMACPALQQESKYMQALEHVEYYQIFKDTLILQDPGMRPLAKFAAIYLR